MKRKFELSIDASYVKSWGIVEAVREFFQNSYDEEVQNPNNKSFFEYDKDNKCIRIGNELSILKSETLLLGCTTKDDNENLIGQFGEGYKIATVVALRTGHNVTIYNYGAKEVWTTKLVKSRKYNGRLVPTFYISNEKFDWLSLFKNSEETKNLIIEISNITEEEYKEIMDSNLNISYPNIVVQNVTEYGQILLDPRFKGRIYVSGLYVYTDKEMEYGYNINSKYLKLDRDRMTVNSFDLKYTTSRIWVYSILDKENNIITKESLFSMLERDVPDLYYVESILMFSISNSESLISEIYAEFLKKYGKNRIPVDSEESRINLNLSLNETAIVNQRLLKILDMYEGEDKIKPLNKKISYYQRYSNLFEALRSYMSESQKEEADSLLAETRYILS